MEIFVESPSGLSGRWVSRGASLAQLRLFERRSSNRGVDVVLGYGDEVSYASPDNPYFGCTVGRFANRISRGQFSIDGRTYQLACNEGPHHLHGGPYRSLAKVEWHGEPFSTSSGAGVRFTYDSPDGEEGYPGRVQVEVVYTLTHDRAMHIAYRAVTGAPTIVNLTNHSYFNLAGHSSGSVLDHLLQVDAKSFVETDEQWIPTGTLRETYGTALDFIRPRRLGDAISEIQSPCAGVLNHCMALSPRTTRPTYAAALSDPRSGRQMRVLTTQPGLLLYAGYYLNEENGKAGAKYFRHSAICLESQHFPDSPRQPAFPSCVVRPGETYRHETRYEFCDAT
ncbi:MAG: galactose mutarotase [Pirellulales bacterium]|nr:galactose mutarotase [Pirellulales bacterium]